MYALVTHTEIELLIKQMHFFFFSVKSRAYLLPHNGHNSLTLKQGLLTVMGPFLSLKQVLLTVMVLFISLNDIELFS